MVMESPNQKQWYQWLWVKIGSGNQILTEFHRISIYIIYERNVREVSPWDFWVSYQTNPKFDIGKLKKWGCLTPNITKIWHGLCRSIRKCQSFAGHVSVAERWKKQPFWPQGGWCDTVANLQRLHVFTQFHKAIALRTCLVQDTCLVIL